MLQEIDLSCSNLVSRPFYIFRVTDNIQFRLSSGYKNYKANGGKVGRKKGSIKTTEQKKEEYKEIIQLLKKRFSVRNVAKVSNRGISTVQRIKTDFCL